MKKMILMLACLVSNQGAITGGVYIDACLASWVFVHMPELPDPFEKPKIIIQTVGPWNYDDPNACWIDECEGVFI